MVKARALHAHADLAGGVLQRALLSRAGGGLRIAREQLQLGGPGSERGELEDETLDSAGRRRLLEPGLQRCAASAVGSFNNTVTSQERFGGAESI